MLSKNANKKNVLLSWYSSTKKKSRKIRIIFDIDFESQILALSDTSLITQFSKFNNILWVCWFTDKNPFENFTTRIAILYTAVWHQKQACYYDWALAFGLKATKCGIRIDRRTLYNLTRNLFIDTYMKVQPYFNVSLACTLRKLLASAFKLSEFSVKMISVKVWTFWEAHKNCAIFLI